MIWENIFIWDFFFFFFFLSLTSRNYHWYAGWKSQEHGMHFRPGWSESSLGAQVILLVLSWGGSNVKCMYLFLLVETPGFVLDVVVCLRFEPPRDKTNKMTVRPAKTQISLGIRPVWSESLLCAQWVAQWVAKDQSFLRPDSEYSDLSLRWAHMSVS